MRFGTVLFTSDRGIRPAVRQSGRRRRGLLVLRARAHPHARPAGGRTSAHRRRAACGVRPDHPAKTVASLGHLFGAGGTERTFRWVAANADGWITTPYETDIADQVRLLDEHWVDAGRAGRPYVVALGGRADPERVAHLVAEVVIGLPDRDEDDVLAFIAKTGARLRWSASPVLVPAQATTADRWWLVARCTFPDVVVAGAG